MGIGFIGSGNMATAIIKGILNKGIYSAEDIYASDISEKAVERVAGELGIKTSTDNVDVVKNSDILVLAVKPQFYEAAINSVKEFIRDEQVIISIAPGKTLEWVTQCFGKDIKLVRIMPNTPALVGEGMTGACRNALVSDEEYNKVLDILGSFGVVETISENLMDVCVSVSGSAPAYVFMMIEAMADGAVADGMPRDKAYKFAAQAVLGSAKMVLETGKHPGELKDQVCSPGGTTIEAVRVLEDKGFRSSIIEAMKACVRKAKGL
jgi:pyrroline-5-carboxylate reductase